VDGTNNSDSITVSTNSTGSRYTVNINGTAQNFKAASVTRIVIDGRDGSDKIRYNEKASRIAVKTVIDGGIGNDRITGSTRNDTIRGGAGRDFILGGKGNEKIEGGDDDDTIFGDAGNDRLFGQGGDDLMGGDDEGTFLIVGRSIPKQITGNDSLDGGDGNDWLMGGVRYEVGAGSVTHQFDDDDTDTMTGGAGADIMDVRGSDDVTTDHNAGQGDTRPNRDLRSFLDEPGHPHALLRIRIRNDDGSLSNVLVPASLGIHGTTADDLDAVHTHDATGRIHFESDDEQPYRIVEILENWGISFDSRSFGRNIRTSGSPITVKVKHENDTSETLTLNELKTYEIEDEDIITITIG
jgi:Ca2+-binding RTX toxin-like protein